MYVRPSFYVAILRKAPVCPDCFSIQGYTMSQYTINALDAETFSQDKNVRRSELQNQNWDRNKSIIMAELEGVSLNDQHWEVINYLREYYVEYGVPRYARSLSRDLAKRFSTQGGTKYLCKLFTGGPVTQGCRFANLRTPASSIDASFGTSY